MTEFMCRRQTSCAEVILVVFATTPFAITVATAKTAADKNASLNEFKKNVGLSRNG